MRLGNAEEHDIRGRINSELHWEHLPIKGHPSRRNDLVPEGDDVLDGLTIQQVRGAFDLDHGFVVADNVVTVLEVEAEGDVSGVLEENSRMGPLMMSSTARAYASVRTVSVANRVNVDKLSTDLAGDIRLPK